MDVLGLGHFYRGHWPGPGSAEVARLGLLPLSCCPGPAPVKVAGSHLLHQRSLTWPRSHRGRWLRPVSSDVAEVAPLYLFLWMFSTDHFICKNSLHEYSVAFSNPFPNGNILSSIVVGCLLYFLFFIL